jgi:hypothetical protein
MLYHAGHGDRLGDAGGEETIRLWLARGDDVLAFWMPCFGPNDCQGTHETLGNQPSATFNPLQVFLEPPIVGINALLAERVYDDIGMLGMSGGGWTTTWVAALDPRIGYSVPVSGDLPLFLQTPPCGGDWVDWEGAESPIYDLVDYTELYVLGAAGGRRQLKVLNKYDPSCFWGVRYLAFSDIVHDVAAGLDGAWSVALDTTHHQHMISAWALQQAFG